MELDDTPWFRRPGLYVSALLHVGIVALTFLWPALAPASREGATYQWLAVGALWIFLAVLAAMVGLKACRAPRT